MFLPLLHLKHMCFSYADHSLIALSKKHLQDWNPKQRPLEIREVTNKREHKIIATSSSFPQEVSQAAQLQVFPIQNQL